MYIFRDQEAQRTYDLTTTSGAFTAMWQTITPLAGAVAAFWFAEVRGGSVVLVIIGLVALLFFLVGILPAWIATVWRWRNDRMMEERRIEMTTERVRLAEIALERDKQRGENLSIMARMNNEQIQYAWELEQSAPVNAEGNRATWTVGGMVMPVTFALDWMEKWEARRAISDDQLPAQGDWNDARYREQCRTYNAAIIGALVKLGYVQSAGSQYPARWLYADDTYRWKGLQLIGLDLSLAISRGILEGDNNV